MILTCQECNATYCVADQVIGLEGKMVKCAKCHHVWFTQDTYKIENCSSNSYFNFMKGSFISISIILLMLLSLGLFPENLMQFKPLDKFYAYFGIYNSKNIVFDEIELLTNGTEVIIQGAIRNVTNQEVNLPNLRYELLNNDKQVIFKSTKKLNGAKLQPNDLYNINSKIINLPEEVAYLKIDIGNQLELMWR